jgi:tetraacyldisaccharide 4'-kinase
MVKLKQIVTTIWNDDRQSDFSNPFCSFLYTLSLPYAGAVRFRNYLYDNGLIETKRLPCPVVSVGNLTVGGTGKTPMVILLANFLQKKGYRPAVLSRGYTGRNRQNSTVITDGRNILLGPDDAGDEPFLIAASTSGVPVLTGRDRYSAGKHALDLLGANVLVLDDAFQHRQVFRNLNILLLDAERPYGNGCILPRGPLREPRIALRRADLIVLTRADEKIPSTFSLDLDREFPEIPVFQARHRPAGIILLSSLHPNMSFSPPIKDFEGRLQRESKEEKTWIPDQVRNDNPLLQKDNSNNLDSLNGKRVCAFAGIAHPESFRKTVESMGAEVVAFKTYPDHHHYTPADMKDILKVSQEHRAEIILTTEKDGVKLSGLSDAVPNICMLRIEMEILSESKRFEDTILARLSA